MNYTNYIAINIDHLIENIADFKKKYSYPYYIMNVSHNAFSHGMYLINYLEDKINFLFTKEISDVRAIRKYRQDLNIIYDGILNEENIYDLVLHNVIIVLHNLDELKMIQGLNLKDDVEFLLAINNDYGFDNKKDIDEASLIINNERHFSLKGIINIHLKEKEYEDFRYLISSLSNLELYILNSEDDKNKIKLSNAILLDNSIYGIFENKSLFKKNSEIKQVWQVYSKIIKIKISSKNKKTTYLGIIPIGEWDNIPVYLNYVFINNEKYRVILVEKEYTVIEVTEKVNINDLVLITETSKNSLIGRGKSLPIVYKTHEKMHIS